MVIRVLLATMAMIAMTGAVFLAPSPLGASQDIGSPLDTSGPISFFIEDGTGVRGYEAGDGDLARMAFDAWSRESGRKIRFAATDIPEAARIRLIWVSANSGLFGQTRSTRIDGRDVALVFVTPEVEALGPGLAARVATDRLLRHAIVYLTCVHELGHALGLGHTRDFADIMYSFGFGGDIVEYFMRYRRRLMTRADIALDSGLSDGDREALHALYPTPLEVAAGAR